MISYRRRAFLRRHLSTPLPAFVRHVHVCVTARVSRILIQVWTRIFGSDTRISRRIGCCMFLHSDECTRVCRIARARARGGADRGGGKEARFDGADELSRCFPARACLRGPSAAARRMPPSWLVPPCASGRGDAAADDLENLGV